MHGKIPNRKCSIKLILFFWDNRHVRIWVCIFYQTEKKHLFANIEDITCSSNNLKRMHFIYRAKDDKGFGVAAVTDQCSAGWSVVTGQPTATICWWAGAAVPADIARCLC